MAEPRKPARENYDAVVDITSVPNFPANANRTLSAYALVKFTFKIVGKECQPAPAEPLFHDLRDPELKPRLKSGTDFWIYKEATDFVVSGSAFAPGGKPTTLMQVSAQIGNASKRINVFGNRLIDWSSGRGPRVGAIAPFVTMPLTYENAYGGLDWRVPWKRGPMGDIPLEFEVDHPGMYPRNPFGKGYMVEPGEVPEAQMPNLEDPEDALTPDRLIVRDPKLWYRQPLPWCFDWVHPMTFPRYVHFIKGTDAYFPGPQDGTMPEVRRGYLENNYRLKMSQWPDANGPFPRFFQEASHGLILKDLKGNEPVTLLGMHPEESQIRFNLPAPLKSMVFELEGARTAVQPRLHAIHCRPAEKMVTMVYAGHAPLPRFFMPGIHKVIPVAVLINNDTPIVYITPQTKHDQLAEGKARMAAEKEGGTPQ